MSDKSGVIKQIATWSLLLSFIIFGALSLTAQTDQHHDASHEGDQGASEEKFEAGKMIVEHITDSYEWHIMDFGNTHITIPLPVILYDDSEWHVFMSSKFHHGHDAYEGYYLSHHDINAGKIVKKDADGHEARPDLDLSITKNVFAIFFSSLLLIIIFISVAKSYQKNRGHAPTGLQSFLEPIILFVRDDIAKASIGEKKYEKYTSFLLTIFFFILLNNLLGLIPLFPGGANVTGNIGVTGVIAVFTFIITTLSANKA